MRLIDQLSLPALGILLNSTWVVTLLLGTICALLRVMRRPSAAFRSMVWNLSLKAVLLSILLVCLPAFWNLMPIHINGVEPVNQLTQVISKAPVPYASPSPIPQEQSQQAPVTVEMRRGLEVRNSVWLLSSCALGVWLVGALFGLARFAVGNVLLRLRSRRIADAHEAEWRSAAEEAARRLQISGDVHLLQSRLVSAPAVWGVRTPMIFLPAQVNWSFERKLVILLHEFAHIKRGDLPELWLQQLVSSLYWFNPIVLLALGDARKSCEQACDDMVLDTGVHPSNYASHLLETSELLLASRLTQPVLGFFGKRSMEGRLMAILNSKASRSTPTAWVKVAVGLVILPLLFVLAETRPFALAQPALGTPSSPQQANNIRQTMQTSGNESSSVEATPQAKPASAASDGPNRELPTVSGAVIPTDSSGPQSCDSIGHPRPTNMDGGNDTIAVPGTPAVQTDLDRKSGIAVPEQSSPPPRSSNTDVTVLLHEGTPVRLSFADGLTSKTAKIGDPVNFMLASDIKVGDTVVVRAGSTAIGKVVSSRRAWAPGVSGALTLQVNYLEDGKGRLRLRGLKDRDGDSSIRFSRPYSLKWPMGLFRTGDNVEIAPGTWLTAYVDEDTALSAAQ